MIWQRDDCIKCFFAIFVISENIVYKIANMAVKKITKRYIKSN